MIIITILLIIFLSEIIRANCHHRRRVCVCEDSRLTPITTPARRPCAQLLTGDTQEIVS